MFGVVVAHGDCEGICEMLNGRLSAQPDSWHINMTRNGNRKGREYSCGAKHIISSREATSLINVFCLASARPEPLVTALRLVRPGGHQKGSARDDPSVREAQ